VAAAAAEVGAEIVAISTDYVFSGKKGAPYVESDETDPLQTYGRAKRDGELRVRETCDRHYIVRSAWIYGNGGKNFLSQIPRLAADDAVIKAVSDQRSSPTYAPDLAGALMGLIASASYGTYHVTNAGSCSFVEFCRHALELLGGDAVIEEVARADLGRPAPRPADTSLESEVWTRAGLAPLRGWKDAAASFCERAAVV
jgi:dTDP-4-dehydrorhamnose reductase